MVVLPRERTVWHFGDLAPAEVGARLAPVGIGQSSEGGVLNFEVIIGDDGGTKVLPSDGLILSLSPDQRTALSEILKEWEENWYYVTPILIESGDPVQWYREAGLAEDVVSMIAQLCYKQGRATVFSDPAVVYRRLPTVESRERFLRAMTLTRTLVARIRIGGGGPGDLEALQYWRAGHKDQDTAPILEAIADSAAVERLDIAHLLPPLPRKLLYTYPGEADTLMGERFDCHWTCLNFFRSQPNGRVWDPNVRGEYFTEKFEAADSLRYGDVVLLNDKATGELVHSAVYLAADIFYTKNGEGLGHPWQLMRYGDLLNYYSINGEVYGTVRRPVD